MFNEIEFWIVFNKLDWYLLGIDVIMKIWIYCIIYFFFFGEEYVYMINFYFI